MTIFESLRAIAVLHNYFAQYDGIDSSEPDEDEEISFELPPDSKYGNIYLFIFTHHYLDSDSALMSTFVQ